MTTPSGPQRKRFYKEAKAAPASGGGYRIELDGRGTKTPGKREIVVPDPALAEALAAEWQAQTDVIDPRAMPLTRMVNSAIDGVADRIEEVRADLVAYAGSDLLCYFADGPQELVERQSKRWGAIHAWAQRAHGIELELAAGVMPVEQRPEMLARIDAAFGDRHPLALAGLHVVTTLTGSALLALALAHGQIDAAEAWALAHIDEDFQIEQWGPDEEARERRQRRWGDMQAAALLIASQPA